MFCPTCGKEISDDSMFCENCGSKISPQENTPASATPGMTAPKAEMEHAKKVFQRLSQLVKQNPKVSASIAGAVVLLTAIIVFFIMQPLSVRLDKYVTVTFTGYDSSGSANYSFDTEAFCEDYAGKLQYEAGDSTPFMSDEDICEMFIQNCVQGELSKQDHLSNGDEIDFIWACDDEMAKKNFGVRLSYKDLSFTVEGLQNIETFDPFEKLELTYSGIGPNGEAEIINNSDAEWANELYYEITPRTGLSNGDTITVSVSNLSDQSSLDYFASVYGVQFTQTEKTYTVEGLGTYVSKLSEITDETLNEMKSRSEDALHAEAAKNWEEYISLDEMTYLGSYLLSAKDPDNTDAQNCVFLVYQVQSSIDLPEKGLNDSFQYYYTVAFDNLILMPDGSINVDLNSYETSSDRFKKQFGDNSYWYYGYESLDKAFQKCVTVYVDRYSYESNLDSDN